MNLRNELRIGIKYCGNCNPHIDSPEIVRTLERTFPSNFLSFFYDDYPYLDLLIILCGCPKKCVDLPEIRQKTAHCLVVGGETLNGVATRDSYLPTVLKKEIINLIELSKEQ